MDQITIRRAEPGDVDGLAASSAALFAEDGATRDRLRNREWPSTHGARWCADLLVDPAALVLVADADDDIVGHLVGSFSEASPMWTAPRAELVSMFVSSTWRRQGLGGRFVDAFVAWARERGASRFRAVVHGARRGPVT